MFKHFLVIFYRSLLKNKQISIVSFFSLSISFAISLLLLNYYNYQTTFDAVGNGDNIVLRAYKSKEINKISEAKSLLTYAPLGPVIKEKVPSVAEFARLYEWREGVLNNGTNKFAQSVFYGDKSLSKIFPFRFINGNMDNFDQPNKIVIAKSLSLKYFGDVNSVGKTLNFHDWFQEVVFEVVGVYEDMPQKLHLNIDILVSFSSLNVNPIWKGTVNNNWESDSFYTYLIANKNVNVDNLSKQINVVTQGLIANDDGSNISFGLQSVEDAYLDSDLKNEIGKSGDGKTIVFLMLIGILIVVIALTNLVNFFISSVADRNIEVSVKKAFGVSEKELRLQFLVQFVIFNSAALLAGSVIFLILVQSNYSGILKTPGQNFDFSFWLVALVLFLVSMLLVGIYPAKVLSSFKLNEKKSVGSDDIIKKSLMVFQYFVSVGLLYGIVIVYSQFNYLADKNPGFENKNVLVLKAPSVIRNDSLFSSSINLVKDRLSKLPSVKSVSMSSAIPGANFDGEFDMSTVNSPKNIVKIRTFIFTDYYFNDIYKVKLLAGRFFNEIYTSDKENSVVINKKLSDQLGFANPSEAIGQKVNFSNSVKTIVGITSDFDIENLKEQHGPVVFGFANHPSLVSFFSLKIEKGLAEQAKGNIEKLYRTEFNIDAEYFYIDDQFNEQYGEELGFYQLFQILTFIAITLTVFGLMGLSFFYASKKSKEIAIRKTFGASEWDIFFILFKYFFYQMLIGSVIALPVFYLLVNNWLERFAFRIGLSPLFFVIPIIIIAIISIITTGYTLFRASTKNPIIALKEN